MISGNQLPSTNHNIGNIKADSFYLSVVIDARTAEDNPVAGDGDDIFLPQDRRTMNLLIIQNDAVCTVVILKNPSTVFQADSGMIP